MINGLTLKVRNYTCSLTTSIRISAERGDALPLDTARV
jgi:hypothetical protein